MPWGYFFHLQNYTMEPNQQKIILPTSKIGRFKGKYQDFQQTFIDLKEIYFIYSFVWIHGINVKTGDFFDVYTDMLN